MIKIGYKSRSRIVLAASIATYSHESENEKKEKKSCATQGQGGPAGGGRS